MKHSTGRFVSRVKPLVFNVFKAVQRETCLKLLCIRAFKRRGARGVYNTYILFIDARARNGHRFSRKAALIGRIDAFNVLGLGLSSMCLNDCVQPAVGLTEIFLEDGINQELSVLAVPGKPNRKAVTDGPGRQRLNKALRVRPALVTVAQNVIQAALYDQAEQVQASAPLALAGETLPAGGQGSGQIVKALPLQGHPVSKTHQRIIPGLEGSLEGLNLRPSRERIGALLPAVYDDFQFKS